MYDILAYTHMLLYLSLSIYIYIHIHIYIYNIYLSFSLSLSLSLFIYLYIYIYTYYIRPRLERLSKSPRIHRGRPARKQLTIISRLGEELV